MSFLTDAWYVIAWSHELPRDAPLARTVLGIAVVMFRDAKGCPSALEDRCPHRGAPLSLGRCEEDGLRCGYHGLLFDRHGQCTQLPGQPGVPARARARAFPVIERSGWVWIWTGEPAAADAAAVPTLEWLDDPRWAYRPGYLKYNVDHRLLLDNLCDFSHLPHVHRATFGVGDAYDRFPAQLERLPDGVRFTRWMIDVEPAAFQTRLGGLTGRVDRWIIHELTLPGLLRLDTGAAPTGTGAPEGRRAGAFQTRGVQAITPETDGSTHYFFAQPHEIADERCDAVSEAILGTLHAAFEEDRRMLEGQQRALSACPGFEPVPIAADAGLVHFRRLRDRRMAAATAAPISPAPSVGT